MHLLSLLVVGAIGLCQAGPLSKRVKSFQWFGVNESGAEFGQNNIPGVLGTDYTFPSNSTLSVRNFWSQPGDGSTNRKADSHWPRIQHLQGTFFDGEGCPQLIDGIHQPCLCWRLDRLNRKLNGSIETLTRWSSYFASRTISPLKVPTPCSIRIILGAIMAMLFRAPRTSRHSGGPWPRSSKGTHE